MVDVNRRHSLTANSGIPWLLHSSKLPLPTMFLEQEETRPSLVTLAFLWTSILQTHVLPGHLERWYEGERLKMSFVGGFS